jgi:uncharacterized protein YdaU (DUF1376 family)
MAKEKAPAFQFYPKDFLTDGNVAAMTLEQRGAYITLLSICWLEHSLPQDQQSLATMVGQPLRSFQKWWPGVERCFQVSGDRLVHGRLDKEREKQETHRRRQSDKGTKGAAKRWPNDSTGIAAAIAEAIPDDSSPISRLTSPPVCPPIRSPLSAESLAWFDRVYRAYPNKDRRKEAEETWLELNPAPDVSSRILKDVTRRVQAGWVKFERRFIPQLRNYLAGRMWEDTAEAPPPYEDDISRLPHAWQCRACGGIHEGTQEQAKSRPCLRAAS